MNTMAELITDSPPLQLISALAQYLQIPRQRSGITAYIHHSFRLHFQDRLQRNFVTSLPGRTPQILTVPSISYFLRDIPSGGMGPKS